jgi:preprotein translocase subunit SecF
MEFFRNPNIRWMDKAKYFVALSATLLVIGGIAWLRQGGLRYGIDFSGGALIYVRFSGTPPIGKIRNALAQQGLANNTLQQISDLSDPSSKNDVVIGIQGKGQGEQLLDQGRTEILAALSKSFPGPAGKQDFNAATPSSLADYLTRQDPLHLGLSAGTRYTQLAQALIHYRDSDLSGIVTSMDQLAKAPGSSPAVVASLGQGYYPGAFSIRDVEIVGPRVGAQLRRQAVLATLYALAGMLVYIAFRFEWIYGTAAVIAVFHDVLITLGFFCLFHYEISLTVIAALLTLVGYSMNDTIVIFDRVRENLRLMRREPLPDIVDRSVNQTLSRTILTSGLTFSAVLVLYLLGGRVLRTFAFAMVVGVVVGTYSSFGIAAPIVVLWSKIRGGQLPTLSGAAPGTGGRQPKARAADRRLAAAGRR